MGLHSHCYEDVIICAGVRLLGDVEALEVTWAPIRNPVNKGHMRCV